MSVLESFFSLLKPKVDRVPDLPESIKITLPDEDDSDEMIPSDASAVRTDINGAVEGQAFYLVYTDPKIGETTRLVTVLAFEQTPGESVFLKCYCHTRKAERIFNLSKIKEVVDLQGNHYEPPHSYLAEVLGVPPQMLAGGGTDDSRLHVNKAKELIRDDARILVTLARADDDYDKSEHNVVLHHCLDIVENAGIELTDQERGELKNYLSRLHPTEGLMWDSVHRLQSRDKSELKSLLMSARELIEADGTIHPEEARIIDDVQAELTGTA